MMSYKIIIFLVPLTICKPLIKKLNIYYGRMFFIAPENKKKTAAKLSITGFAAVFMFLKCQIQVIKP